MRNLRWTCLTILFLLVLSLPRMGEAGQKRLGRSALHVLKVDQGVRMSGMGGAFVAIANDIEAIYVNPAGLTHIEDSAFTLSYSKWLVDSKFYSAAFAKNTGNGTLGVSVVAFALPDMEETTIFQPRGTGRMLDSGDFSVALVYARKMTDKLSVGLRGRWTQETLDTDHLTALDFNLGTYLYTGFGSLRVAMTLGNLGKDLQVREVTYRLPATFSVAAAMEAFGSQGEQTYLTLTAENYYATDYAAPQFRIGGELWFHNSLAIRGGYKFNFDVETYSLGMGLKISPTQGRDLRADFSYTNFGNAFNAPLRVALSGSF